MLPLLIVAAVLFFLFKTCSVPPVDKKTWFTFDRLEFETGSANLEPSSMEQLKNIAEIIKAYPQVTLKLGGYTDDTGNRQISDDITLAS